MMKPKYTVLSVAIAAILVGCGGTTTEKQAEMAPEKTAGSAAVEVKASPAPVVEQQPKVEPKTVAPVVQAAPDPTPAPVAAPKRKLDIPSDPNTFLVTSSTKTNEHPSFGKGLDTGFDINGKPGKEVVVTRGEKYKFIVDTGVKHDFYFTTNRVGWGAGTYVDGVEGQFIYKGEVTFEPGKTTPDLLYYQCRNHKSMGGKIFVLDKGEDLAKVKAALAASDVGEKSKKRRAFVITAGAVKQKLGYAQMVIGSGSAKRVENSGDQQAIAMLNNARGQIESAKASLAGDQLDQAMTQVNEGLRLMTAASRKITTESEMAGVNHKAKFEELSNSLKTYEGSYKKNMERVTKAKQPLKAKLDQAEYERLVAEGKSLASKGDHVEANKSLEKAQSMITSVLTSMLHAQTVTYDKNFETPQEEYEYELARYENYEELIPLAIEQKQPSQRALELVDSFVQKAAKIRDEGKQVAAKGDHKMAIMAIQAATSNLQRALRMVGVN